MNVESQPVYIQTLIEKLEKPLENPSERLADQIIIQTCTYVIKFRNLLEFELKSRICNLFLNYFEVHKEKESKMEIESVLSVFNLVKELNVNELQFKLMQLLEGHVYSNNEHILDTLFTKIYIESLIQCYSISVEKTKPSVYSFIASMINKLLF